MTAALTRTDVVVEPLPDRGESHRAADVLRLIIASSVFLAAALLSALAHTGVSKTERSLLESVVTLPAGLRDLLTGIAQLVLILVPVGILVVALVRRRFGLFGRFILTAAVATVTAYVFSHLVFQNSHPASWHQLLYGRGGIFDTTFPPVDWLCGAIALVMVASPELPQRWRMALWWTIGTAAVVEVMTGGFLPVDAVAAGALGITVGSAALAVFGAPSNRPEAAEIVDALQECGVDVCSLKEEVPARGDPAFFVATTREGAALSVRVLAGDDESRSRLARMSRWLLLRNPQDGRISTDVEAAAEHELLAMVTAARAGARVPEPVVAYPVGGRHGHRGSLVAWMAVDGRRMDVLTAEQISDATLHDLWSSVAQLRAHHLAHRALRTEHIVVDDSGNAWLTGFGQGELGAPDALLDNDVAELLTSLALQVGVDRAVSSAIDGLGAETVAHASSYLQPLALLGVTGAKAYEFDRARRVRLTGRDRARTLRPGQRPELVRDLRTAVEKATAMPPAARERLSRFTWKNTTALLGAFVVLHLVLPQLANFPAAIDALRTADWWWVLAALPAIFIAQAFSTLLQLGAIPARLPFGPTYVVQFGGSFLNKVTPANVGGMALNFRYLQKTGVDAGAATGSVGLQSIAGYLASFILLGGFLAATGRSTSVHLGFHSRQLEFLLITVLLVACALFGLTPWGRKYFHDKVWGFLKSAGSTIAEVAKSPSHVVAVIVGAFGGPLVQITALAMCIHAVGGTLPFVQVGAIYMGAKLLAGAAPVPGGLGALETALIGGLSALGMPVGPAASAVLIYRLLTYWLGLPIGWVGLKIAESRGYV
jgi:uncharacterized protein (TIRG00374 family)